MTTITTHIAGKDGRCQICQSTLPETAHKLASDPQFQPVKAGDRIASYETILGQHAYFVGTEDSNSKCTEAK